MNIQGKVVEEFGSESAQNFYLEKAEEGLWPSEEVVVEEYFPDEGRVLDVGCGTGRTTIPLKEMGYDVIGLDITPKMIENANKIASEKELDIEYVVGDATDLDYDDESFDCVLFSNNGWTQIPGAGNRRKALEEIKRVLKKGGVLVFTTHVRTMNGFFWFWVKQLFKQYLLQPFGFDYGLLDFGDRYFRAESGGTVFRNEQYIHIPNVKKVKKLLEDVGFDVVRMERANEITGKKTHEFSPMFYVCTKD